VLTDRALSPEDFPVTSTIGVRWSDVDMYGHVNNAVYYQWFDTAINEWLGHAAGVDPRSSDIVGVVGESACLFTAEVRFGDDVTVGLGVREIGTSSVTYYAVAFVGRQGHVHVAAHGHWVHVYKMRSGPAVAMPDPIRKAASALHMSLDPFILRKSEPRLR
jgi:acyl-CoA thioester hydrolase